MAVLRKTYSETFCLAALYAATESGAKESKRRIKTIPNRKSSLVACARRELFDYFFTLIFGKFQLNKVARIRRAKMNTQVITALRVMLICNLSST